MKLTCKIYSMIFHYIKKIEINIFEKISNSNQYTISKDFLPNLMQILTPNSLGEGGCIYTKCNACNVTAYHKVSSMVINYNKETIYRFCVILGNEVKLILDVDEYNFYFAQPNALQKHFVENDIKQTNQNVFFVSYAFSCNQFHEQIMLISCEIKEGRFIIRKIGQFPSLRDLKNHSFSKYKSVINADAYSFLTSADELYNFGYCIASYLYIRRALETIINRFETTAKIEPKNHSMLGQRLDAVKKMFCPKIQPYIKKISDILGDGIHNLSEEDCQKNYNLILKALTIQYNYELSEKEQDATLKELDSI